MRAILFGIGFICCLWNVSCSKKTVPAPQKVKVQEPDFTKYIGSTSFVNHVGIEKKLLTDTLDGLLDDMLGEPIMADYDIKVTVRRSKSTKINADKKSLLLEVPLDLFLEKQTLFGLVKADGAVTFTIKSDVSIDPKWKLTTNSKLITHAWNRTPKLKLGIDIPAQFFSDLAIEKLSPEILKIIDQSIAKEMHLDDIVKGVVKNIEEPFQFDDEVGIWYAPAITTISLTDFSNEANKINSTLTVGITNQVSTIKPIQKPRTANPQFSWNSSPKDSAEVSILLEIEYKTINNMIKSQYLGQTFTEAGRSVTVSDIHVSSESGILILNTTLTGDFNGTISLAAKPYYDKNANALKVSDVDVKYDTRNILAKSAAWLLKGKIRQEITDMLDIPLSPYKKELQDQVDLMLQDYKKENFIYLYARLGSMDIPNIYFGEDRIKGILNFKMFTSSYLNDKRFFD